MREIKQKVHVSIIGHQPNGNFAVQEWIDEQISKLPASHDIVNAHLQVFINPMKHEVSFHLDLESSS